MGRQRARAEIVVDLGALRHNVRTLRAWVSDPAPVQLMVVVKADGYGHGMLPVARAAREAGAHWLGVATLDEARRLREAGDRGPLLCWLTVPGEDYGEAVAADVDVTAYTLAELEEIAAAAAHAHHPARVQLKVDTGLSRGGAGPAQWPALVARARRGEVEGSWRVTGVWSHLSSSDVPDDPANAGQEKLFEEALAVAAAAGLRPDVRHLANSAAAILRPSSRYDLVRCGIAAYGLDPAPGHTPDLGLVPVMTARAELALVRSVQPGTAVSYGHTWTAAAPTTLGLVPVGYADGLPRLAGNRADVAVAGRRCPVRGMICMDQLVVDLHGDTPATGSEVVLFGTGRDGGPTAQDWAVAAETIVYEIVTRIGGRMIRTVLDPGAPRPAAAGGGS